MSDEIIFTTVHGSRLYGLDHAGSDEDSMVVYAGRRKPIHEHNGRVDIIHTGLPDLLEYAYGGSLQFVEGVFSQKKVWVDTTWQAMFSAVRIPVSAVRDNYMGVMSNLIRLDTQKHRQHAVRLGMTLHDLRENDGQFNPTLSRAQRARVIELATNYRQTELMQAIKDTVL